MLEKGKIASAKGNLLQAFDIQVIIGEASEEKNVQYDLEIEEMTQR